MLLHTSIDDMKHTLVTILVTKKMDTHFYE